MAGLQALIPCRAIAAAFDRVCQVNPCGDLQTPFELVNGCTFWEYRQGHQAAFVALERFTFSGGCRVHVVALQSTGNEPLQMRQLMSDIEATARELGADLLTLFTQHEAIAAGAQRWGAHISGAIVQKNLRST
jgi:hypothetical protein